MPQALFAMKWEWLICILSVIFIGAGSCFSQSSEDWEKACIELSIHHPADMSKKLKFGEELKFSVKEVAEYFKAGRVGELLKCCGIKEPKSSDYAQICFAYSRTGIGLHKFNYFADGNLVAQPPSSSFYKTEGNRIDVELIEGGFSDVLKKLPKGKTLEIDLSHCRGGSWDEAGVVVSHMLASKGSKELRYWIADVDDRGTAKTWRANTLRSSAERYEAHFKFKAGKETASAAEFITAAAKLLHYEVMNDDGATLGKNVVQEPIPLHGGIYFRAITAWSFTEPRK